MERILINCNECYINERHDAKLINFNYDDVKNIIDSNYITYIYYCNHKINELANIVNNDAQFLSFNLKYKYACIKNINYLKTYNRFIVKKDEEKLIIVLDSNDYKSREISIEEFMTTIKKGSIIMIIDYYRPMLLQKLEKLLLEHNSNFILKKLEYSTFVIDTPNYTKPSIKHAYNNN